MNHHPQQALPGEPLEGFTCLFLDALAALARERPDGFGGVFIPPKSVRSRLPAHRLVPLAGRTHASIRHDATVDDLLRVGVGQNSA
jgi:hypothetical protein